MDYLTNLTNGQVFILCAVAFLATLIIPRLLKRRKIMKTIYEKKRKGETLTPEDFQGATSLFYTHNGKKNEVEVFLGELKSYAFKHSMKIVFPGAIHFQGAVSPSTMILVGNFGILLIRCYGYGGQIYYNKKNGSWFQNMNGEEKEILDPVKSMAQEEKLARRALTFHSFGGVRVFTASVFTRSNVVLDHNTGAHVYDKKGFMDWLAGNPVFAEDSGNDVSALSQLLVKLVKDETKQKK